MKLKLDSGSFQVYSVINCNKKDSFSYIDAIMSEELRVENTHLHLTYRNIFFIFFILINVQYSLKGIIIIIQVLKCIYSTHAHV